MSDPLDFDDEDDLGFPSVAGRPAPPPPTSRFAVEAPPPAWLDGLNDAQRTAVDAMDGPVLVLAGAGTGKTRVLTTRLANILHTQRARPYQMLVVTFTNKAAKEMKERVTQLVGPSAEGMWLGTFHALATKMLRRHAEMVGLESNFTILDTDDQIRLLKQILTAEHVDEKRWPARMLIHVIQRWKDKGWTPDKVGRGEAGDIANGKAVEIYRQYQERLKTLNAADFGDLLLHCLTLFTENPEILERFQNLFQYILVDEYQDTNVSQYLWLRLLAQKNKNICCVGDDDQSIYGWRGAEVGNILKFEKDFPGATVVRLERNYRSTNHILGAAAGIIQQNEGRLGKTLYTDEEGGEKVSIHGVWDGEEEARNVCDEIENQQRKGFSLNEMAVLVRAGFQTREFEERLITLGIPYRVIGGARFYEREEIRDALAYLRVVHQPNDDLALERIINKPARGIGKTTLQAMHQVSRLENISLYRAGLRLLETDELKPAGRRALGKILDDFNRWSSLAAGVDHIELTETILDESGYTDFWKQSKKPEAPGKLENLKEMIVALDDFENLAEYLEHVALVMENEEKSGENDEKVSLMTLHAAKGLEFDVVFLPGWEEGLFPSQRTMDENGLAGLEEERRLAYVGITRARKILHIMFAANRRIHGQWQSAIPSRFIDELPQEHLNVDVDRGLYSGSGGGRAEDRSQFSFDGYGGGSSFDNYSTPRPGGPGWQRMQAQQVSQGRQFTTAASRYKGQGKKTASSKSGHGYKEGDRVFHQKFGMGNVKAVDGDHLSIEFDHAGVKKVVAAFVEQP
ncbi:ATP-dependent helicase [Curvivirga aplysinae]|uniref:ATP-dependent helicase n=1 Tax=Curvivirga aplysinae TaxID=2529852 RepID=UPI0012BD5E20|nr:UvrD-helicase domain-containing protein [Curvivirga aplysinae]MTI10767.1 DNA helicase II [Curvivirga aplysinae]